MKWQNFKEGKTLTLFITPKERRITIVESTGHWKSETGGFCTYDEFRQGRFHSLIRNDFGGDVLEQVREIVGTEEVEDEA